MSSSTPVRNKVNEVVEKIIEEIEELYKAFKESKEVIVGRKIIDVNKVDTRYCYAVDLTIMMYQEVRVGLRVVCELDFEVHDDDVIDLSDIRSRKEMLIFKLIKRQEV
jgi:hypothetical protein